MPYVITLLRQLGFFESKSTNRIVFWKGWRWRATRCNFRRVSAKASSTRRMAVRSNATPGSWRGRGPVVLPQANVRASRNDLRFKQTAAAYLVCGHVSPHAIETGHIQPRTFAPARDYATRRLEDEA